jgi:hypothetical protein
MGLERIHLEDQGMKDAGICMYMKHLDQEREQRGNFSMDQFEEAQDDEKQQQALHDFERRNEGQAGLV